MRDAPHLHQWLAGGAFDDGWKRASDHGRTEPPTGGKGRGAAHMQAYLAAIPIGSLVCHTCFYIPGECGRTGHHDN